MALKRSKNWPLLACTLGFFSMAVLGIVFDMRDDPVYSGNVVDGSGRPDGVEPGVWTWLDDDAIRDVLENDYNGNIDGKRITCKSKNLQYYCEEVDPLALLCYILTFGLLLLYILEVTFEKFNNGGVGYNTLETLAEFDDAEADGIHKTELQSETYHSRMRSAKAGFTFTMVCSHTEVQRKPGLMGALGGEVTKNVVTKVVQKHMDVTFAYDNSEAWTQSVYKMTDTQYSKHHVWRTKADKKMHDVVLANWVQLETSDEHQDITSNLFIPGFEHRILEGDRPPWASNAKYTIFAALMLAWPYRLCVQTLYGKASRRIVKEVCIIRNNDEENTFKANLEESTRGHKEKMDHIRRKEEEAVANEKREEIRLRREAERRDALEERDFGFGDLDVDEGYDIGYGGAFEFDVKGRKL
jgi:hypothetical protein